MYRSLAFVFVAATFALALDPAFAQTAQVVVPANEVANSTKVTIEWGAMVSAVLSNIGYAVFVVLMWLIRKLPSQVVAILQTIRIDQILEKAIQFGINSVQGAVQGRGVTIDTGNAVFAQALAYAMKHAGSFLESAGNDPRMIAEKIWARLNVDPNTPMPDFNSAILAAKSAVILGARADELNATK